MDPGLLEDRAVDSAIARVFGVDLLTGRSSDSLLHDDTTINLYRVTDDHKLIGFRPVFSVEDNSVLPGDIIYHNLVSINLKFEDSTGSIANQGCCKIPDKCRCPGPITLTAPDGIDKIFLKYQNSPKELYAIEVEYRQPDGVSTTKPFSLDGANNACDVSHANYVANDCSFVEFDLAGKKLLGSIYSLAPAFSSDGKPTHAAEGHAFIYNTHANCDCASSENSIFTIPNVLPDMFPTYASEVVNTRKVTNLVSYFYREASYGPN